ncbi:MAG: hypothetical protein V5B36_05460 [Candidatus Accumulibacter sp. UW25]|jgi:hypothetical protein
MSFLDKAKQAAGDAFKRTVEAAKPASDLTANKSEEVLQFVKNSMPRSIPMSVSGAQLNEMVATTISETAGSKAFN